MRYEFRNIQENVYKAKLATLQNNLDAVIREQTGFYTRTICELIDRIDKAIEYINDLDNCKNVYANGDRTITNDYIIKLLDILKGEDNE